MKKSKHVDDNIIIYQLSNAKSYKSLSASSSEKNGQPASQSRPISALFPKENGFKNESLNIEFESSY